MYYIYRHIRPDKNQVFYIGLGKFSKTYNRSKDKRRNKLWLNIVNKNSGKYKVEIILEDLTFEQAIEKEKEFIELYGKIIDKSGTLANVLNFGSGSIKGFISEENKQLLKLRMIGNKYALNHKWDEEQKQKFSDSRKGHKNNLGKKWSEETKNKMSLAHLGNKSTKGYKKITDGKIVKFLKPDEKMPENFKYLVNNKTNN
jgi:hypothetical protein